VDVRYRVLFWVGPSGEKPVAQWLKSLVTKDRLYLGGLMRDLAYDGPSSRPKVFKHLEGSLWEIRDLRHPGPGLRVYFGYDGNTIVVVVAGGDKSTQQRDIDLAKKRLRTKGENE
jgi:putative addiction module killer protein